MLDEARERQVDACRAFMSEPGGDEITSLFSRTKIPSVLGSPGFVDRLEKQLRKI